MFSCGSAILVEMEFGDDTRSKAGTKNKLNSHMALDQN